MGAGVSGPARTGGRRGRRRSQPMGDINVTPLVDVMLVLLIIFMVTAPLLTVGVPIDLPKTEAKQLSSDSEPLTVSVSKAGKVYLQEREIGLDEIVPKLVAITKSGYDQRIFVRGDGEANYSAVMKVMGALSAAGFRRLALVTAQEDPA
jgi:biopolymer transport protein TolR